MTFNIIENGGEYLLRFEYCTELFKSETANRIVKHFEKILKAVTENANQKLGNYLTLNDQYHRRIVT